MLLQIGMVCSRTNLGGRGRRSSTSKDRRSAALELQAVKLKAGEAPLPFTDQRR
jgi:hypothetical protein